jgi:transposase
MLKVRRETQIYVSLSPIDMRKAIDSLAALVVEEFQNNPQSGHLFIFFNRSRDKVKIIYWDKNGFVLHYKRKEGVAHDVLKFIALLAKIEEEIKELSPADKLTARLEKAKPVLDNLHAYLTAMLPRIPPKSPLGQAVSYTLNQWAKLNHYLRDGRLENNNNRSERAIKPFVIGRKGWLFSDSVAGAEAAAIIFSLVETCKHHNVEPYDWFRYVLQHIPLCKTPDEIEALLPFNIDMNLLPKLFD